MNRFRTTLLIAMLALLVAARPVPAQIGDLLKQLPSIPGGVPSTGSLGDVKIGQGLKEALQVSTEKAVSLTGRTDGYFKNEAIKILMPDNLKSVDRGLRTVGYGPQLDELVLSMNRAAEQAAPAAKNIFWNAIGDMSIDDATKILHGGNTAATDYFKGKTTPQLTSAFTPVVEKSMSHVGVTQQYEALLGRAKAIPVPQHGVVRPQPLRRRQVAQRPLPRGRRTGSPDPRQPRRPHDRTAQGSIRPQVAERSIAGPFRGPVRECNAREAPWLRQGAERGGYGGPSRGPPISTYTRRAGSGCETAPA